MSDFHVQLLSNSSTAEFPSNQPNHFKNRMPYPLQFREPGWKVGVSAMSLPEAPRKMDLKNPFLFRFQWLELVEPDYSIYAEESVSIREGDLSMVPRTGTELLNMIRDKYLWELNDQSNWDLQLMKRKENDDDPDELSFMVMHRAENGECVIDNTRTSTSIEINSTPRYPKLSIGIELAKAMGWVVSGKLGPNLRKEFPSHIVPKAVDLVPRPVNNGDRIFYKIDPDVLHLSCFINWVFMDLDASFEKAFGNNQRPMYLYLGSSRSMIVGNQVTDLIREVPYSLGNRYFEPNQIQYLPVRSDSLDIIETQVAEVDGQLVEFSPGVTSMTLHFKHE